MNRFVHPVSALCTARAPAPKAGSVKRAGFDVHRTIRVDAFERLQSSRTLDLEIHGDSYLSNVGRAAITRIFM
jgi:hypothetical protein